MFKNTLQGLSIVLGLIFIIGCASKGIEMRRYVEIKDRVDQKMEGNAGYLTGDPQPEDRSQFRKTRKIYVLEVSQGDLVGENVFENVEEGMDEDSVVMEDFDYESDNFIEVSRDSVTIPYIDDAADTEDFELAPVFTEYTVKKDDTLQKISKKFYDSFSQWPKIYEVNKGVIDNPDKIKPGIVIQIPID